MLKYLGCLILTKRKQKAKWSCNKDIKPWTFPLINFLFLFLSNFSHTLETNLLIKLSQQSQLLDYLISKLLDRSHYYSGYFRG